MKLVNTTEQPPSQDQTHSPSLTPNTLPHAGSHTGVWFVLVLVLSGSIYGFWHFYQLSELYWGFAHQANIGKIDPAGNRYWSEVISGAPGTKQIASGEKR